MFSHLQAAPTDPILGLMAAYTQDTRPFKIDLGVGVYKDEAGNTPILACVKEAEARRGRNETTKTYIGMAGDPGFNAQIDQLSLGGARALVDQRVATAHTPGGTGAVRVAADLIKRCRPEATVWMSDPTWGNHPAVFKAAGLAVREYPYYDPATQSLRADAMFDAVAQVPAGDVVLLHACCHNPSGVDLAPEHWQRVAEMAQRQGFVPLVDMAYQGFSSDLDSDAYGVRLLADALPELIYTTSCSKNFGLYRERIGAVSVIAATAEQTTVAKSHLLSTIRNNYSMPPAHGALIVAEILDNAALKAQWLGELAAMRDRINSYRSLMVSRLRDAGVERDFGFIERQRGMFSFLGIAPEQIQRLREEFAIYMVGSSRANIAGLNQRNMDHFVSAMATVLRD